MDTDQIIYFVAALILGMLLANMLKNVCGCKVVEGQEGTCVVNPEQPISRTGGQWTGYCNNVTSSNCKDRTDPVLDEIFPCKKPTGISGH